ncbi:D-alanine--D-alanine ligase family protein [Aquisalimonas asiatica]|uniref:D-alanine-D-alanine ligase n=1 Tax=Aquisalimonas asiatica TaxID=406100 RepID=A0A1H8UBQ4_9GAMM|nr:D-alanine--D-alanine ligase [Aquisalimonas asiatica]SEP00048.1 D-alanine-D-alanine ligase [Aquisalimonas asiatica]
MTAARELTIGVLSGDPDLPYSYGVDGRFSAEDIAAATTVATTVNALDGYRAVAFNNHSELLDTLRQNPPDLALNFCDTGYRNLLHHEPNVPALLELLDIPYTGATPASMALCADKALVRLLAASHGIPVPNETVVDLHADPLVLPDLYPAMIKPNDGCGSLGVSPQSVVHDAAEAQACLRRLAEEATAVRPRALIQDFLTGAEYTLGLVGNPDTGLTVLPPLEIDYSQLDPSLPPILSYGSKADPDSPYWQALQFRRAELDTGTRAAMVEQAIWLFERLGFRDYARLDFRAGADGVPRLLDANFNPTWNHDGKMAIMAGWAGHSYGDLLRMILEAARRRYGL